MNDMAVACYAVLRALVPSRTDARLSYTNLVNRLPDAFQYLDMENVQHRNELSAALGEIVGACRAHVPRLPPLPAIVVRRVNGELEYPGEGYFTVAHPDEPDELRRLTLWGHDVQEVQQ